MVANTFYFERLFDLLYAEFLVTKKRVRKQMTILQRRCQYTGVAQSFEKANKHKGNTFPFLVIHGPES